MKCSSRKGMSTVLGGRESVGEGLESGDSAVLLAYLVKSLVLGVPKRCLRTPAGGVPLLLLILLQKLSLMKRTLLRLLKKMMRVEMRLETGEGVELSRKKMQNRVPWRGDCRPFVCCLWLRPWCLELVVCRRLSVLFESPQEKFEAALESVEMRVGQPLLGQNYYWSRERALGLPEGHGTVGWKTMKKGHKCQCKGLTTLQACLESFVNLLLKERGLFVWEGEADRPVGCLVFLDVGGRSQEALDGMKPTEEKKGLDVNVHTA